MKQNIGVLIGVGMLKHMLNQQLISEYEYLKMKEDFERRMESLKKSGE